MSERPRFDEVEVNEKEDGSDDDEWKYLNGTMIPQEKGRKEKNENNNTQESS